LAGCIKKLIDTLQQLLNRAVQDYINVLLAKIDKDIICLLATQSFREVQVGL